MTLILNTIVIVALVALIELLLFGSAWAVQEAAHKAIPESGGYWIRRAWRLGMTSLMFKFVLGYYLVLAVFCYIKNISLSSFVPGKVLQGSLLAFVITLLVMALVVWLRGGGNFSNLSDWLTSIVRLKAPLGNEAVIGLLTAILSPWVLSLLIRLFRVN